MTAQPAPTPMPTRGDHSAPVFQSAFDLPSYLEELERLFAEHAVVDDRQKISNAIRYLPYDEARVWRTAEAYTDDTKTYDEFRAEIVELYPGIFPEGQSTRADLESLVSDRASTPIQTRAELGEYHRRFKIIADDLRKKHAGALFSENDANELFIRGFTGDLCDRLVRCLQMALPQHHLELAYPRTTVFEEADAILAGQRGPPASAASPPPATIAPEDLTSAIQSAVDARMASVESLLAGFISSFGAAAGAHSHNGTASITSPALSPRQIPIHAAMPTPISAVPRDQTTRNQTPLMSNFFATCPSTPSTLSSTALVTTVAPHSSPACSTSLTSITRAVHFANEQHDGHAIDDIRNRPAPVPIRDPTPERVTLLPPTPLRKYMPPDFAPSPLRKTAPSAPAPSAPSSFVANAATTPAPGPRPLVVALQSGPSVFSPKPPAPPDSAPSAPSLSVQITAATPAPGPHSPTAAPLSARQPPTLRCSGSASCQYSVVDPDSLPLHIVNTYLHQVPFVPVRRKLRDAPSPAADPRSLPPFDTTSTSPATEQARSPSPHPVPPLRVSANSSPSPLPSRFAADCLQPPPIQHSTVNDTSISVFATAVHSSPSISAPTTDSRNPTLSPHNPGSTLDAVQQRAHVDSTGPPEEFRTERRRTTDVSLADFASSTHTRPLAAVSLPPNTSPPAPAPLRSMPTTQNTLTNARRQPTSTPPVQCNASPPRLKILACSPALPLRRPRRITRSSAARRLLSRLSRSTHPHQHHSLPPHPSLRRAH